MKYLDLFFNHLKLNFFKNQSMNHYRILLKRALTFIEEKLHISNEKEITEKHLIDYLIHLKNTEKSEFNYCRSISYIKKYFQFLESEKIIFINPAINFDLKSEKSNRIKPIEKNELLEILSKIETKTDFGIRSKAMFEVLYSTGIRPLELRNIKILQVDFYNKEIFIERGKCLKDRVVPVGEVAIFWIKEYLAKVRPKYIRDKSNPYLFITINLTGRKLTKRGLAGIIQNTFKLNKIKPFYAYAFRVSCATHCLLNGMDILHIQKLLGHSSIRTTKGYVHVDEFDLKKILDKQHPRNKY